MANSVSVAYRNPVNATFANLGYSYSVRGNNLLFVNNIAQNGGIERNAIEQKNRNYSQSVSGSLSKNFREIKTTVSVGASFFSQKSQQIINKSLATVVSEGLSSNLRVSSSLSKWFGLEYAYKLSSLKNIINEVSKPNIIQQNHDLKLNFNPAEKWYLGVNTELYINNFNSTQNLFSDLIFRRTVGEKKIDLEATWSNIFNTKSLLSVSNGTFNYVETAYILRPSQIVAKVRLPF